MVYEGVKRRLISVVAFDLRGIWCNWFYCGVWGWGVIALVFS